MAKLHFNIYDKNVCGARSFGTRELNRVTCADCRSQYHNFSSSKKKSGSINRILLVVFGIVFSWMIICFIAVAAIFCFMAEPIMCWCSYHDNAALELQSAYLSGGLELSNTLEVK